METLKRQLELKEKELAAIQTKYVPLQKMASQVFNNYCNIKK